MKRNIKLILLLSVYITIITLQTTLFAIDDFITFQFLIVTVFEKLTGKSLQQFIDDANIYEGIRNNRLIPEQQKNNIIRELNDNIIAKVVDFISNIFVKFNIGLTQGCISSNLSISIDEVPSVRGVNIEDEVLEVQNKINNSLNLLFRCFKYDSPELKELFSGIDQILFYIRNAIIALFVMLIIIIVILVLKLLSGANLLLFTIIKNLIAFAVILILVILFTIFLFFPTILTALDINKLDVFGIDDFSNTLTLRTKNWGASFILLLVILIIVVLKSVFIDTIKVTK